MRRRLTTKKRGNSKINHQGLPHRHDVHKHKKNMEIQRRRPQDKGTSYNSSLLFAHPSISEMARSNNMNSNDNAVTEGNNQRKPPPETLTTNDSFASTYDDDYDEGGYRSDNSGVRTLKDEEWQSNNDTIDFDLERKQKPQQNSSDDDHQHSEKSSEDEDSLSYDEDESSMEGDDTEDKVGSSDDDEDDDDDNDERLSDEDVEDDCVDDKWTCFIYGDGGSEWPLMFTTRPLMRMIGTRFRRYS